MATICGRTFFASRAFLICALVFGLLLPLKSYGIINGTAAAEGEFPWQVAILKKGNFQNYPLFGGGVLIDQQWVLTSAHSLQSESASSIQIWLGIEDLSDTTNRIVRNVVAIYTHPDFSSSNSITTNDLALVLLDHPVTTIPTIPFITDESDISPGDDCVVAGWGTTTPGTAEASEILHKADARVLTTMFANSLYGGALNSTHLPARDPALTSTPCFGDSGSGLIKSIDAVDTVVGLVGFGSDTCEDASIPTVYTNVAMYASWIQGFLDLTAEPSSIEVYGKNRLIQNGDKKPRRADGSDFGKFLSTKKKVNRTFRVQNGGDGLLTIRASSVSGNKFKIRKAPSKVLGASATSTLQVTFRPRRAKRKNRSLIRLYTNDPNDPIYLFRIEAKVR